MLANANPYGIWYLHNSNDYQRVSESIKKDRFQSQGASAHITFATLSILYERFNIWSFDADLTGFAVYSIH